MKENPAGNIYYTFIDALENEVVLEKKPERVVSLVGSYGETWILAGGSLVGVTDDVEKENRMEITDDISLVGTIREPNVEEFEDYLEMLDISTDITERKDLYEKNLVFCLLEPFLQVLKPKKMII